MSWRQDIWRAEQIRDPIDKTMKIAPGSVTEDNGFRTRLFLKLIEFVRYGRECFFPGNARPVSLSALAHAFDRVVESVGMLLKLQGTIGFFAGVAFADGVFLIGK
jgi:hypothetical protein